MQLYDIFVWHVIMDRLFYAFCENRFSYISFTRDVFLAHFLLNLCKLRLRLFHTVFLIVLPKLFFKSSKIWNILFDFIMFTVLYNLISVKVLVHLIFKHPLRIINNNMIHIVHLLHTWWSFLVLYVFIYLFVYLFVVFCILHFYYK